jgi:integrase/recombinase XerD
MALKRRGSKGIFWTDFKVAKRRIRVSTGFTDLKLARQREAELKNEARFARLGWRKAAPAFSEWAKTYESAFTVQKAQGTQRRDREILARAREFFGTTPVDQIARSDCEGYVNWRRKTGNSNPTYKATLRPLADGTITREVSFLQAMFQAAMDDALLETNPWRKVKRERYTSRERVISATEQVAVEAQLPVRFLRFFHFLLGTGARLDEARNVEPSDIDWNRGTVHVVGKFGKDRDIPLAPEVVKVLRAQVAAEGRLWHQNPQRLRAVLARAAKRADVVIISPHVCRHTFATRYLQRGGDIYTLSRILGHASVSVTERHYAHLVNTDIVELSRHVLPGIVQGGLRGVTHTAKRR